MAADTLSVKPNELAKALKTNQTPLLFEVLPPLKKTPLEKIDAKARELYEKLRTLRRLPTILAPDIVEEQHGGVPQRRRIDPTKFVTQISEPLGVEAVVNQGVVYYGSAQDFRDGVRGKLRLGVRNHVFVGGGERYHVYPGPTVNDALRLASPEVEANGGLLGAILLQGRKGEAQKMFYKTVAGAKFFTSQLTFESGPVIHTLTQYYKICKEFDLTPATVFLSFTPVHPTTSAEEREDDTDFLKSLGAAFSDSSQGFIYDSGPAAKTVERSIKNALRAYAETRSALEATGVLVNTGLMVAQFRGDATPAVDMARELIDAAELPTSELRREATASVDGNSE